MTNLPPPKTLVDYLLELLASLFTSQHLAAAGAGPDALRGSVTTIMDLPSGFDQAAETAAAVSRLESLQAEAIALFPADPLPGGHWRTKCNFGLMHQADGLGCRDLDGLNATCIVRHVAQLCLVTGSGWSEGTPERGIRHASRGGFGFQGIEAPPGEDHGHVAGIAPRPGAMSPSWGILEPILANVGKPPNGFKLASACFLESERPAIRTFLWKDE